MSDTNSTVVFTKKNYFLDILFSPPQLRTPLFHHVYHSKFQVGLPWGQTLDIIFAVASNSTSDKPLPPQETG